MDILYFCGPPLLDYSVEQIGDLKIHVNLHVIVPVSLSTPNHSIFKLKNNHNIVAGVYTFDEIKEQIENYSLFENYFVGCKSIYFVFFSSRFGINILLTNIKIINIIRIINPQIIHFDDISGRLSILALLLKNKKIVLNVHDPSQHSGEQKWTDKVIRKLLYRKISAFCTFSDYSKSLFEKLYSIAVPVVGLRLVPYKSYLLFENKKVNGIDKLPNEKVLLFFGRISQYKGLDEFLLTFVSLKKKFPNIKLVIAGKGSYRYHIPTELVGSSSLIIINRFILQNEIRSIFEQADLLVCPYRDATQSGVLMTAAVFETPAIVSNVGALPEYISDGKNGYIYDINDELGLENAIVKFLFSEKSSNQISRAIINHDASNNSKLLCKVYLNLLIKH